MICFCCGKVLVAIKFRAPIFCEECRGEHVLCGACFNQFHWMDLLGWTTDRMLIPNAPESLADMKYGLSMCPSRGRLVALVLEGVGNG